jgi:hypothetical protein
MDHAVSDIEVEIADEGAETRPVECRIDKDHWRPVESLQGGLARPLCATPNSRRIR